MAQNAQSPALAKLEKEFTQNGGQWREFNLKDLFHCERGTRLVKSHRIKGDLPLLTAGEFNQGVKEFISNENQQIFSNAVTIDMFCNSFVHIENFCCDDNILVLNAKTPMNKSHLLFISTAIQKDKAKYGFGKQYRKNSFESHKIQLPAHKNGEIAFDFMQSYIAELEAERIAELEAYLQATGLKDYELNEDEKAALKAFESLENSHQKSPSPCGFGGGLFNENSQNSHHENLKWREFKIGELFSVKSNPQLNKDSFNFSESGEYPYFTRTCLNNGISGYVDYLDDEHKIKGKSIAVGMLGMQFFYMEKDFYAGQFTKTIYPKFEPFNPKIAHYFITLFNKHQKALQAMLVRDFEKTFLTTKLHLPTHENGEIDFDFMRVFIKAIEKEVIKGVVLYSTKRLTATKQIIEKPTPNNKNKKAK